MKKLTIGMAHFNDYDGAYFTIQALRMYHSDVIKDIEIVVVDNSPSNSPHSQVLQGLVKGWAAIGSGGSQYISMQDKVGTSSSRNKVFEAATSDYVVCCDCHVLFPPNSITSLMKHYDQYPDTQDLISGPLLYDDLHTVSTHFNDRWRGEMWGIWGLAWQCPCGEDGVKFSTLNSAEMGDENQNCYYGMLEMGFTPITKCGACGKDLPRIAWAGHEKALIENGYTLPNEGEPFEIPGMGLGCFSSRKDAWLGFNLDALGFGGEEMYIHEKYRQEGNKSLCVFGFKWGHRFGRPNGVPYPISRWNKIRNYVLEFQELGMSLDPIQEHFVDTNLMTSEAWDHLLIDPKRNVTEPAGGCSTCPGNEDSKSISDATSLDALFELLRPKNRDLNFHMPKLRELSEKCDHVTEFSKRQESMVALLSGNPKIFRSYNTEVGNIPNRAQHLAANQENGEAIDVKVRVLDSPRVEEIDETDMLFIDSTEHTYNRLTEELSKYAPSVKRFIVFHDTKLHGERGEDGGPGLLKSLRDYMKDHTEWSVIYHTPSQFGLTVISRDKKDKPSLPSVIEMTANLAKSAIKHIASGSNASTKEELESRLEVCTLCDHRKDERCTVCGCFMAKKAAWREEECPLGKWPALNVAPIVT